MLIIIKGKFYETKEGKYNYFNSYIQIFSFFAPIHCFFVVNLNNLTYCSAHKTTLSDFMFQSWCYLAVILGKPKFGLPRSTLFFKESWQVQELCLEF